VTDVNDVMLPTAFDGRAEIQENMPKIRHPERLHDFICCPPNQAMICYDDGTIKVQNNYGNHCSLINIK
jgi:hypothetical protein